MASKKYQELLGQAYRTTGGQGAVFSHDEKGNVYVDQYTGQGQRERVAYTPPTWDEGSRELHWRDEDKDENGHSSKYNELLSLAYEATGGKGAVFQHDEQGNVFVQEYQPQAAQQAEQQKKVQPAEDNRSTLQRVMDRILGVDSSQITGEKTDWKKLFKGLWYKGADQYSTSIAGGLNWLLGDAAEEVHTLGVQTINDIIGGVNSITGADIAPVENKGNLLTRWYNRLKSDKAKNEEVFRDNANSSRAAQIVDNFGTSFVAAVPMALEAIMTAPYAAAKAGAGATTAGLQYFAGLQSAKGLEAAGMMASHAQGQLLRNPQFWTTYVQAIGDSAETAEESGMSPRDAAIYTLLNGYFNAVIEIGGADETLGGIQNLPMRARLALESGDKLGLVDWFKDSVLGEGLEEVAQGIFERGLKAPATGAPVASLDVNDTDAVFNPWTAAQEFTGGAVVGGLLGGGQTALGQITNRGAQPQQQTQTRQQQTQSAQETGRQLVRQTLSSMGVSQAEEQVLMSGFEAGEADAQTYANGIREAYRLGELGESLESAREQAQFGAELNETQFRHAWQLGAQKAGNSTAETESVSREAYTAPEYESIEDFAQAFPHPEKVTEVLTAALNPLNMADLNQVAQAFKTAYDMGQSGVSSKYFTPENIYGLTREQAQTAYELGRTDAAAQAEGQAATIGQGRRAGNLARARGTVKGEGVSMADLKAAFNDPQRTAYRLLTRYAETTGVNIVLYNSQADTSGRFPGQQGRFEWKDNTIYIDINSGVSNMKSVGDLGQYTMMRTFAHEFTHFIEKWNPAQYNEFREFVFASLEEKGENVHDLIQGQQMRDASGKMSYEQASREVVADAMMDILPDSRLVQQLADEHPNVFTTLRRKLREFTARMKQHYSEISRKAPREAEALKANGAYADSIVQMWDRIAKGAVENYQSANGELLFDQPGKPGNLPKRNARQQRNNAQIREENAQNGEEMPAQPETRPASIDFFARSEGTEAEMQDIRQQPGIRRITPVGRERFGGNDLTSQAEAGPDIRQQPGVQRVAPAGRERFAPNDFTSRAEAGPDLKGMVPRAAERTSEGESVEEVIEAAEESSAPLEPVPPTEQTEAAKKRLKKGVQTPVQISNTEAIRQGLFRKELTPDNITLTGTVRGLNAEQRAVIIRELLEAHYAGKKEAKISVPYDGKFTLTTEAEAVAYVIGALKAKVTQDVLFDRKLDAHLRKANPPSTFKLKGNWYISNGFDIIPITEEAAKYAQSSEGYKARITSMQKVMEEALDDDYAPLDTMPDEVTLSNGAKYYRFNIEGRELFFEKDTLDYFDGGRMSYKQMNVTWTGGRTQTMDFIRATDENGDVIGYVLATVINPALKITREMPGKLKSFKPGKAQKAAKTTPAPARAEPAHAPTRTTEAQEKPAEAKEGARSRFPLQEWKKGTPSQKAAYRILTEYLRTGKGLPSKDLYAICDEAFGGTQAEGAYNRKDAYDAMELAVNRYLLEAMKYYNSGTIDNAIKGVEKALEIVNKLPTQNVRTKEQLEYQQFSTPPSIAYIAAWAANINARDHVLEPSAGIGGLAAFAKAWGAEVTVNELSERRLEVLRAMGFDHIFNENAEHIDNILPDDIRPTAVIMNPPFSSTAGRTTTNKTSNAEAHINSALDRLAENGRLVAILGRGMADDKYGKYWDRLRKEYTIRANIGIDGENYKKYGTTFDVQIVVIDKVGPQGEARTFTGSYKNLVDAIKALEGTRNDRSAEVEQQPRVTGNPEAVATGSGEEQAVHPPVAEGDATNSGRAVAEPGPEPGGEREPGGADVQRSERGAESVPDARTGERGAVEQQRPGKKNPGSRKAAQRNDGLQPDAGATGAVSDVQGEPGQQRGGLSAEPARARQVSADPVTDDGVYTGYRAPDIPLKGTKAHPAVLVESAAMGAVDMPKATYTPHLPDSVTKTGALSTEQLVSVTYAGQAHEQMLPNGERRGFFVGDGTGVGKGRTICGVILDNFNQGRRKAVWITERSNLLTDAVRDWTAISGRDKSDIKDLSKVKLGQKVDHKEGILFTTYATLRSEKGNLSRLDQIIDWLGKDFDGVLVFDEAHNMGNLQGKTGGWGKKGSGGASMAIAGAELQKRLPKARVLYCSATAATEVSGLAFASRLGLWGEGTAFTDVNDFVSKIGSAGLSAMELVVRDMKAMGMYLARSVSFNGVEYDTIEHKLDPVQREIYNTMSRAWQKTMQSVEQSLAETGARHNSQAKQRAIGQYYNSIQRFYNQVLTSMSMPSVIADIKKELAAGRSCVLQIVNTNQAEAERQISAIKAREGELDEMDLTPRGTLIDYLMKYYPVQLFEEYTDEHGNIRSKPVTNSKGEAVIDKKAVARRDALIQEINEMSIPDGPLEMLFDAFGTEAVAEITGRSRRVVPRRQQDGSLVRVEESRGAAAREADVKAFQDGEKRILIFSDAGGTGKSYHADLNAKNQQQRVHYVVQPGWQASKAVQGFGRTNRSNQASAPIYKLVTTDVKGQKRFTSTIARRLDQLGALTKGQRDTGSGMFGASDNLETDLARDSLREFYRRLGMGMLRDIDGRSTLQKMGLLNKFSDEYGNFKMDEETARNIGRFLNRILALEIDEQNRVFDAFIEIYEAEMEAAIKAGTLDLGMENVKADKIEILDDKTIYKQEGTGAETHYVQAKVYTRPEILESVAAAKKISWGRTFMGLYRTKGGDVRAVYEMPDKTDQYGRVHKQYRLQSPNYSKTSTWIDTTFTRNAEAIPEAEWDAAWDEEVKKVPEYNEEVKHMLTGSLLPVWDRIENDGIAKVQRLISDDGKAYLGRIIPADRIDNVLGRFHVARTRESYTGKSVMQRIIQRGETYQLAYYRAKLFRSRVSGEYRLEYSQPQNTRFVQQQFPGIMMERINYVDRFFIPLNEKGEALLDKMLTNNPVANVVERGDNTTEYSTRREDSMSNRDVLAAAAAEMDAVDLNDAERGALNIFRERLTRLQEEQEHRQELGQQYRDQQFTRGGSRQEADRIRAAMQVSDSKIKALENGLLSLENKEVLKGVLIKARGVIEAEERRLGDEKLKRYRERRNESLAAAHYRERVRQTADTLRKWLMSPSNKDIRKHVPAEIQKSVADFLESINFMSKTALRTGGLETTKADEAYLKNMKKMRDAIKENADFHGLYSGYSDLPEDFLDTFQALIDKTERLMAGNSGGFVVNRMNARELQDLYRTLRTLRKFIVEMNSFHNNAVFKHAYDAGEETIGHLGKFAKSRKSGMIYNFLRFQYMRPSYAFEHFGKGGQSIEKEFRDGQAVQADLANKIVKFATDTYKGSEVKAWSEEVKTFKLASKETISLPVTHIMSLYCLNRRAQALTHIYGDGIRVANYKADGKVHLDEGHLVSIGDVQKMIQTLTPRQIEVADALQKYMSTECAAWGNYVSMKRFDVEQFGEENYFPINSDGRYLPATAEESPDNSGLYALLNMGFTKELREKASNRIILYNIFDVFANHTASMTQYRAFALPVLDALKWFNYKNEATSVRDKLSLAFGAPEETRAGSGSKGYAEQFVINLIRAYNGTSAQGDPYDAPGMMGLHRFNRAQIAFNARVVIQQPMAITRAAMMLPPAKLMAGLGMSATHLQSLAAEMEEHSGIAKWKRLGFYDTNISRGLTELIKQNPSFGDRVTETGTKGAETADRLTWAAMWYAAKASVKRSSYESEAAYFQAVTDLFEDVIYKTQVVDSVLTKGEFLRAKGFFPRMLGSFMSEPLTTVSMLTDAYYKYTDDVQQGMGRSEAWRRNGANIAKTAAVYTIGQILLAGMQAIMDAWRDDEEYDVENPFNNFLQRYLNAFKTNVIEELQPFGKIPLVSELYEALKSLLDYGGVFDKLGLDMYGNDISNGWAQYAKYLQKAAEITIDHLKEGGKTNYTWYGAIYNLIRGVAGLTGYPIATAWREVQDVWNNTVGYVSPRLKLDTYRRAIDRQYIETVRPTGLAQKTFEKILADADAAGDGNGSLKQDELGAELLAAMQRGEINEEQADAIWRTKWNSAKSKTFAKWREEGGAPAPAAESETAARTATPAAVPMATPEPKASGYEQFKSSAPLYSTKRDSTYSAWETYLKPAGMSLDRFTEILTMADTDGNGSLKQDELGYALRASVMAGEMSFAQASVVWDAQGWKHDLNYWAGRH